LREVKANKAKKNKSIMGEVGLIKEASSIKRRVSLMYLCTALHFSVFRS